MTLIIEILFIIFLLLIAVPVCFLALQVAASLFAAQKPSSQALQPSQSSQKLSVAILIPAHNEELVIANTIQQLQQVVHQNVRIIVIADNCIDGTADIAQNLDVDVICRNEPNKKGKGFALSYGVDYLALNPPEIVIIIDADCKVNAGAIEHLITCVAREGRPAQALYLMENQASLNVKQKISAFAFVVKNYVRLLGMKTLKLPSHLVGTGMAFSWDTIRTANLSSANIVEDMQLGLDLARQGEAAVFCPEAVVTSHFPESDEGMHQQKTRWEHGHLQTLLTEALPLAWYGIKSKRWSNLFLALDLAIPPLSVLVLFLLGGFFVIFCFAVFGVSLIPILLFMTVATIFFITMILAWWYYGRDILRSRDLWDIPNYIWQKSSIYKAFIFNRQKKWIRTDRT